MVALSSTRSEVFGLERPFGKEHLNVGPCLNILDPHPTHLHFWTQVRNSSLHFSSIAKVPNKVWIKLRVTTNKFLTIFGCGSAPTPKTGNFGHNTPAIVAIFMKLGLEIPNYRHPNAQILSKYDKTRFSLNWTLGQFSL